MSLLRGQDALNGLEATWSSTISLCESLGEADWSRQTGCPGWDVRDQVAHIIGIESDLLGRPSAAGDTDDFVVRLEVGVTSRRSLSPTELLDELRDVTSERLKLLRDADLTEEGFSPFGPMEVGRFLGIRAFDSYAHEQDIRRAVGRSGHLEGPVPVHARETILRGLGRLGLPDGTVLVFDIDGATRPIVFSDGKGRVVDDAPGSATVTLSMPLETFIALGCGRSDADRSQVSITGDRVVGEDVVGRMSVTP